MLENSFKDETNQMTTLTQDMDQTYQNIKGCILKEAGKLQHLYELDDLISCGNVAFMKAYRTFDESFGYQFTTWLYWKMKGELANHKRIESARRNKQRRLSETPEKGAICRSSEGISRKDKLQKLMEEATEDAKILIEMVLENKSRQPARRALKQIKKEWPKDRFSAAVAEVQEVLAIL